MAKYLKGYPTVIDQTVMKPLVVLVPSFIKPNHITLFRLLFIPLVIYLLITGNYLLGGIWFLVLGFSDAVDGSVARLRDEVTEIGRWFDPMADKLLVVLTGLFMITKFLNLWIFLAIFLIELLISTRAIYRKMTVGTIKVQANIPGKIKLVLQVVGVAFIFINASFGVSWALEASFWALAVSILFAILSFFDYESV